MKPSRRDFLMSSAAAAIGAAAMQTGSAQAHGAERRPPNIVVYIADQVNLAGRKEYRAKANELAAQLKKMMVAAGEPEPEIRPTTLYP